MRNIRFANVDVPEELKRATLARVAECWDKASRGPDDIGPCPAVYFYHGRRAAGLAHGDHTVGFHAGFLASNTENMLHETVPHELAHIIVIRRAIRASRAGTLLRRPQPHGREWKAVMRRVFGVEPERTHSYDMSVSGARTLRVIPYTCPCGTTHMITRRRAASVEAGKRYICRKCRGYIYAVAGSGPSRK